MRVIFFILCLFITITCLIGCGDQQSNIALGTLERDRVVFKATASEIILSLPTKEGSLVKTGDLLVQLDDRRQQAKVAHAKAEVMHASAALEQLRNGARKEEVDSARATVHGAQSSFDLAEKNLLRAKQLI
jgi:HlyD family secretion protein